MTLALVDVRREVNRESLNEERDDEIDIPTAMMPLKPPKRPTEVCVTWYMLSNHDPVPSGPLPISVRLAQSTHHQDVLKG